MSESLDALIKELEAAAGKLRAGELGQDEAAALVERCAELAARIGTELERWGREAERDLPAEGQEQLL
jgi:inactivated superfamily I helicase